MPPEQRNVTRYLFLHPVGRVLYHPWEETVAASVAHLRAIGGADQDSRNSPHSSANSSSNHLDFARIWERYEVHERRGGTKSFRHPKVGEMTLSFEVMRSSAGARRHSASSSATPRPAPRTRAAMLRLETAAAPQSGPPSAGCAE
ncbi:MmyB family transcriptional regulator [Yinghuangia aomiensis]